MIDFPNRFLHLCKEKSDVVLVVKENYFTQPSHEVDSLGPKLASLQSKKILTWNHPLMLADVKWAEQIHYRFT